MARRGDGSRSVAPPAVRPPLQHEFSAGGLVYRRRRGGIEVVLAARRHPQTGALVWTIPKGHVEPGERVEEAARREVREETGLEAEIDRPLGDVTYFYARKAHSEPAVRIFKRVRFFLMRVRGGRFRDRDREMDAVRWFTVRDAIGTASHANERALVRRAATLLGGEAGSQ